jgi:hypothetical protein
MSRSAVDGGRPEDSIAAIRVAAAAAVRRRFDLKASAAATARARRQRVAVIYASSGDAPPAFVRELADHTGQLQRHQRVGPAAGLIADAAGDLFSTTDFGGANGYTGGSSGYGTVFELTGTQFQAPVLSGGGDTVNYMPQGAAVMVDAGLDVGDVYTGTLADATVTIGTGFIAGDTLNFANQNGITGSYNASTGGLHAFGLTQSIRPIELK